MKNVLVSIKRHLYTEGHTICYDGLGLFAYLFLGSYYQWKVTPESLGAFVFLLLLRFPVALVVYDDRDRRRNIR